MVTACLEKRLGRDPRLVFTVPLPEREPVFMSMHISEYSRDNCGVVIVDAQKFLARWRADPNERHKAEANDTPETWPSDYKYKEAVDGFALGRENPVPLAEVNLAHYIDTIVSYKFWRFGKTVRKHRLDCVTVHERHHKNDLASVAPLRGFSSAVRFVQNARTVQARWRGGHVVSHHR